MIDQDEHDDEDCAVAVDFHATGLAVNTVLNTHGDADEYIKSLYPSWSGTIAELIGKYFEQRNIPNLPAKFEKIHHLKGDARRKALEDDVRERALDIAPPTPPAAGKVLKRNKQEAYDEEEEECLTPGGGTKTTTVRTEVPTPVFMERISRRGVNDDEVLTRVEKSMAVYDGAIKEYEADGNIVVTKPKKANGKKEKKEPEVISMATHKTMVDSLQATIKQLRNNISSKKKKGEQLPDPTEVKRLKREVAEAQQAAASLLNRHQVTQQEVLVLQQKLKSTEEIKKAAVAEGKLEVMQSFMGTGAGGTPTFSRVS